MLKVIFIHVRELYCHMNAALGISQEGRGTGRHLHKA